MPNCTRCSILFKEKVPGSVKDRYLSVLPGAISGAATAIHWIQCNSRKRLTLRPATSKLKLAQKNANW